MYPGISHYQKGNFRTLVGILEYVIGRQSLMSFIYIDTFSCYFKQQKELYVVMAL